MQHYRMTLNDALDHYQKGWITATALLYYYLKIRLKKGWKVTLHQREIKKQLGIPKTSFYRAIENLGKEGLINWEAPNGLVVELADDNEIDGNEETPPPSSSQQDELIESHEWNSSPTNGTGSPTNGTGSPTNGTGSPTNGTKTLDKPSPSKNSSDSSNSYQTFINSLSDSERENFLSFVEEKTKNLSQPINDIEAWLASKNQAGLNRWEVYHEKFLASLKKQSSDSEERAIEKKHQEQWKAWKLKIEQRSVRTEEASPPSRRSSQAMSIKTATTEGEHQK
jgi:hypothetical protein